MVKRVDIKVGFLCNNRCKFCVQGNKREKTPSKSLERIKRELVEGRETAEEVVFTGGEPALRLGELIIMIRYAKRLKYRIIQIQSNGRLFAYMDFCRSLINAGANEFSPAIHGSNEKIHDFLTASSGSFKQTVQGIRNLRNLGQVIITNTVITTCNYRFLPEIASLLVGLDVDQFQFAFPHILGSAYINKNWLIPKKSEIIKYVKQGLDIGIKAGRRVMTEAIPYCFMQGYEDYIAEKIIPETKIFDADFIVEQYSKHRKEIGKIKRSNCKRCIYDNICEGPWREYPEIFGWDEFKPIRNEQF